MGIKYDALSTSDQELVALQAKIALAILKDSEGGGDSS